jgi:predicted double-glycine peptidase
MHRAVFYISLLVLCTGYIEKSLASDIGVYLPGTGGTVINKRVVSMEAAKFKNVVRQQTDFSCGAASLATILKHAYGMDVDELSVMQGLLQVSNPAIVMKKGFSLLDLKNYAEALGFRARGYRVTLERLKTIRVPTIVMLDLEGYKHFVVLKRIVDGKAYLADPSLGNKVIDEADFIEAWANKTVFAVIGSGFDRDTVLLDLERPPSAKRWMAANGPLTDSELLEFGFGYSDLF